MFLIEYFSEMWRLASARQDQGIFFFIVLYMLLTFGYSSIYQYRTSRWPSVNGTLVKAEIEKVGLAKRIRSNQDYVASAVYDYWVEGVQYQGKRVSPWVMMASHNARFALKKQMSYLQQNSDGSVRVFYNPKTPQKSFLIKPGIVGMTVTAILAIVPISFYLVEYHF